jgi:hypothetical protein
MGKIQREALPDRVTTAWLLLVRTRMPVDPRFVYCVTNCDDFTAYRLI